MVCAMHTTSQTAAWPLSTQLCSCSCPRTRSVPSTAPARLRSGASLLQSAQRPASSLQSLSNGAVKPPNQESFVDVSDVLREASDLGQDFIFEDNEETDVWTHEHRLSREPPQGISEEPKVKGALDPDQTDILSAYSSEQGFREMTVDQLKQELDSTAAKPFVLDVRSAWEFSRGRVPGAVNISMDDLSSKVKAGELDGVRDRTIAIVCAAGIRSAQAAVRLHKVFGFQDVVNVKGGTTEWIKAGYLVDA